MEQDLQGRRKVRGGGRAEALDLELEGVGLNEHLVSGSTPAREDPVLGDHHSWWPRWVRGH